MENYCFQCQCSSIGRIMLNVSTIVECCTLHAVGGKLNASAKPHKVRANERQKRHTKVKHVQENCQKCQRQDMHPTTTMCCMMCERKHRNLLNIHKYIFIKECLDLLILRCQARPCSTYSFLRGECTRMCVALQLVCGKPEVHTCNFPLLLTIVNCKWSALYGLHRGFGII